MTTPIWKPTEKAIAASNMTRFIAEVNSTHKLKLNNYSNLYQWSIDQPELFWSSVWDFCGIISSEKSEDALTTGNQMPGAKWFPDAKLNFAENLLRHRDKKEAIIFRGESGERITLTYEQLYQQVANLSAALTQAGIKVGDRVVGFMPNIPETIIAMLATTSIGAIWSCCSPDFGTQGVLDRFKQIEPKILFTADGYSYNGKIYDSLGKIKEIQEHLPSLEKIVILPLINQSPNLAGLHLGILFHEFIIREGQDTKEIKFKQLPFNHAVYIMFSSGTTGIPKCIVHGAGGTLIQHLKELILHTDLTAEDNIFYFTTCGWMMWNWLVSALATGATVVLYDGSPAHPKESLFFDLIDEEKISIFGTSARYISSIAKLGLIPNQTHSLTTLKTILTTGSPLVNENYEYVYDNVKKDLRLSSISGGTDIISCFALGNPILPVYKGELQCIGLGMKVEVFNDAGKSVKNEKGELVCTAPTPSMPLYFWNDKEGTKYHKAYFEKFPGVWAHGDYAEITEHQGLIIHGRSDSTLNPGGVRIGTAEIYRQLEHIDEVIDSIVVDQEVENDTRIILFIILRDGIQLSEEIKQKIKNKIKVNASPRHVPAKIIQINDIPRTISGKIVELAVQDVIHGRVVKNISAIANPEALEQFKNLSELND